MRRLGILALTFLLGAPLSAAAVDAPHEAGASCKSCHLGHNAAGAGLTKLAGNYNLCNSCHVPGLGFGFPWPESAQAVPGTSGHSHSWSAAASNRGATPPLAGTPMGERLDQGKLQCSTCHDQHQADTFAVGGRGTQHVGTVEKQVTAGGNGTLAVTSAPGDLAAKGYVIQFTTGGAVGTARFQVSNDNKISWVQTNVTTAASVTLGDGVVLAFGGTTFVATEEYSFYVSYPYLRVDNTDAQMCLTCHKDRNMTWENVEGGGTHPGTGQAIVVGTTYLSHPVNQPLAKTYDRTVGTNGPILDADGSTADANPTNDLTLGSAGKVTCLTCHNPHNADSNSLSVDER